VNARRSATLLPPFDRGFFTSDETLTALGAGELGGKASGLAFVRDNILPTLPLDPAGGIEVVLPRLTVLTTDVFEAFVQRNGLLELVLSGASDDRIAHAFQLAELPVELVGDLRSLAEQVRSPLAIRSSSLLEDALAHPFAGVYATKMIPNNQPGADARFVKLVEAVKLVYASTYFTSARLYRESVGSDAEDERMAVIIQEVVGNRHGDRFYPDVSGVARSLDYYPVKGASPEDGVVNLALGLGKTIVDGGRCWTCSPARPAAPPPFGSCRELLQNTQTSFWAVHMGAPPPYDPLRETEYLAHAQLSDALVDGTLDPLASTYDPQSDQVRPGVRSRGPFVLDFAGVLRGGAPPLSECLTEMLSASKAAAGTEVEIEFALTLGHRPGTPSRLGYLQVRPMARPGAQVEVDPAELDSRAVVAASESCLGNGCHEDLRDVVFLKPGEFSPEHTRTMAGELAELNGALLREGTPYLLAGFGRWGSSEPWLGVPVTWDQISGATVLVEATLPGMSPEMSQGAHFFQNLISFRVLYLSLPAGCRFSVDWDWLDRQECHRETRFARHVRTEKPLLVKVDGRSRRGVVARRD
jgi:hypothetical protein